MRENGGLAHIEYIPLSAHPTLSLTCRLRAAPSPAGGGMGLRPFKLPIESAFPKSKVLELTMQ
jgi:hypothetical protein